MTKQNKSNKPKIRPELIPSGGFTKGQLMCAMAFNNAGKSKIVAATSKQLKEDN